MQNVHQLQRKKLAINIYTSAVDSVQIVLNTNRFHTRKCYQESHIKLANWKKQSLSCSQPFRTWERLLGDRCSRDFDLCVSLLERMDAITKKKK